MPIDRQPPKKKKRQAENAPAAAATWPSNLLVFLEKRAAAVALCAVFIAVVRIAFTYSELSITFDEPAHIACGMQYLSNHVYQYEPQHPPLSRAMVALFPYWSGIRPTGQPNMWLEGVEEFYQGGHTGRTLALARAGILPFFLLAALTVYLWGLRYFDRPAAAIAVVLFTLIPPVLAHAGLATTDMALAACLSAAFYAMVVWAEEPSAKNSVIFGGASAMAVLSKFTALGFLPSAALFAVIAWWMAKRPAAAELSNLLKARLVPFAIASLTAAAAIWTFYFFSIGKSQAYGMTLPAPELFDGLARSIHHATQEGGGYLFGRLDKSGFWYFFPVIIALKTPIAMLLLISIGLVACLRNRQWLPMVLIAGVLVPAMSSHVNYGVRHVLPVFVGLSLIAAVGVMRLIEAANTKTIAGLGLAALFLWLLVSGTIHHPDYLAYGNELAGSEPEKVMVDSDLDWGQQAVRLARRLREVGATSVGYFTMNLDSEHLQKWPGLPPVHPIHPLEPSEGWTAVSPTFWKVGQYGLDHKLPGIEPWFTSIPATERVDTLILYYVPPGTLRKTQ